MSTSLARGARALTFALACSTTALSPSFAFAADPAPAGPETPSEADRLFEQGIAARKAGNLAEAEAYFQKAWALKKTWDIAANLGLVELNLGKLPEGANHVYYALTELPPTESKATRTKLFEAFRDARRDVAGFDVRCDVDGAEVLVNGKPVGPTPVRRTQFAAPGQVTVEVRKDGYETQRKTVTLEKSSNNTVAFTMVKAAPAGERSRVPAFVIGGVGVASLAAGAALLGVSLATRADLQAVAHDDFCWSEPIPSSGATQQCDRWRARALEAATLGNAGIGLLVAAGVAAGATTGYLIWRSDASRRPAAAWLLTPLVGSDGGGAALRGTF